MGAEVKRSSDVTYWAEWQFTPQEWQHFDRMEQWHTWRLAMQQVTLSVAVALAFCGVEGLFGFSKHDSQESLTIRLSALACFFGFMLLFGMWRASLEYSLGQSLQTARRQGPRTVRISPGTIQIGALKSTAITNYQPRELVSVTLRPSQPAVLQFTTLTAKRSLSARRYTLWVPVPAGHEAEAAALAARFRREVIGKDRIYWDTPRAPQSSPRPRPAAHPTRPLPPRAIARKPKKP